MDAHDNAEQASRVHDGAQPEAPALTQRSRVQRTKVCYTTCEPKWDAELIFPLSITDIQDVMDGEAGAARPLVVDQSPRL
jgi:hypothetical protein